MKAPYERCQVDDCDRDAVRRSHVLCEMHYFRQRRHGDPKTRKYARGNLAERLKDALKPGTVPAHRPDLGECWVYAGTPSPRGYAQIKVDGRSRSLHRFMYEQEHGPVDPDLHIDHLCRNPACARVSHLEAVTPRENAMRGETLAAMYVARDHCANGHAYTPANTRMYRNGRVCRTCSDEAVARYRARLGHRPGRKKAG